MLAALRRRAPRSLGARLVLLLTLVGVLGAVAAAALLAAIIAPSFNELERRALDAHVERTRAALAEYRSKVESAVRDYGDWNASYAYVAAPTRAFERESFSPLAMQNLDVEGMAYADNAGHVLIARWIDEAGRERPGTRGALVRAIGGLDLQRRLARRSSASFFARVGDEIAAVGVARVRRSDGTGTPRGFVLMARTMTSARLSELLQLKARIRLGAPAEPLVRQSASRSLITLPLDGLDGRAVASARFRVARDVSLLGRRMLLLAVAGSVLLLLVLLLVLRRAIARLVLVPLARVERHMEKVRVSGSLTPLEDQARADEIGALGRSFNAMVSQLKDLREQIEVQSFALGRSESAVAVMHNVRNALSPISTVISHGIAKAPPVDAATLLRAAAELEGAALDDARRRKLAAFVAAGVAAMEKARAEQVEQLGIGRDALAHVLEIIGQQQAAAHERPQVAPCDVVEIVARNAAIARYSGGISIAFRYPAAPRQVLANRVILSQVIGNLFANAGEAIAAAGRSSGSVSVTIGAEDGAVALRITDDGEGFDPGSAPTLFQRGYSTRAHKSGGLGLHWCANSVVAMGGTLRLESEGRGMGATAILTLADAEVDAASPPAVAEALPLADAA